MLLRRPDLHPARRRLASALREESAAKKAFLPVNLTGSAGFGAEDMTFLLDKDSLVWSIAGGVAQRLEGGRIKGNIELAEGRYREALATYANKYVDSFSGSGDQHAAEALVERGQALEQAVTEAERCIDFRGGSV